MEKEKSCGCVIIDDKKVLLIQQTDGNWGFPKGHVENNETEKETALRETKEETNLDVEIIDDKRYINTYQTDRKTIKDVVYFVAKPLSYNINKQEIEIQEVQWLEFEEAFKRLTYRNTTEILKNVLEDIK